MPASDLRAGFPSLAMDYYAALIDLNEELIKNSLSTYFPEVGGDSMQDVRIYDGDKVLIDTSIKQSVITEQSIHTYNKDKVVCELNGEFTIMGASEDILGTFVKGLPTEEVYI